MMSAAERRRRLMSAMQRVGVMNPAGVADEIAEELETRYAEPHRSYHTMDHIESCLAWLDWAYGQAHRPAEVELALWFHDAIYDPTRRDNEERSAELAEGFLQAHGAPAHSIERMGEMIRATKAHQASHGDAALVCSIDLSVLGAEPRSYARYEAAVRREYGYVPEAAYREGRRHFLQALLERPAIYANLALRDLLECAARRNLRAACRPWVVSDGPR
jgi:predicted metal-dependent HD superfamily phosphohydrolase